MTGLHRLERSSTEPAVGRDVEAWCAKCGRAMEHTIVAMVGIEVIQVRCRTCGGTHKYKTVREVARAEAQPRAATEAKADKARPSTAEKGSRAPAKPKAEPTEVRAARVVYQRLMNQRDVQSALAYAVTLEPSAGQLIDHKQFGYGVVDEVLLNKARILFADGYRTLVVGRTL